MALKIDDIIEVNLILVGIKLINTQEEAVSFRRAVGTEVRVSDVSTGSELINRSLTLDRDRIAVAVDAERSVISREFPKEDDLDRLSEVAGMAIDNSILEGQNLRALGYNIDLVCEPETSQSAIEYLGERLFIPNLLRQEGRELLGGSARLYFEKGGHRWQIALEPRFNEEATSRVFAGINLHRGETGLTVPTEDEIRDSLKLVWAEAHSLLSQLDGGTQ